MSKTKLAISLGIIIIVLLVGSHFINSNQEGDVTMEDYNIEGLSIPTREVARMMVNWPANPNDPPGTMNSLMPSNYDLELAVEKGLGTSEGFSNRYLNMQALYRKALEQYLAEKLNIRYFDEVLIESELGFIPVPDERMGFYQRYSTFGFSFVHLRNHLPIERLSIEDLDILSRYIEARSSSVTEDLLELVSRTYRNIIIAWEGQESDTLIGFSNDGEQAAPNNSLVLVVAHRPAFGEDGNLISTPDEERARREFIMYELIPQMEATFSEALGIPVVAFHERW